MFLDKHCEDCRHIVLNIVFLPPFFKTRMKWKKAKGDTIFYTLYFHNLHHLQKQVYVLAKSVVRYVAVTARAL